MKWNSVKSACNNPDLAPCINFALIIKNVKIVNKIKVSH